MPVPRQPDIRLDHQEKALIESLDSFSKHLSSEKGRKVELRIAGGWVRDKLLGLGSHDMDVAISQMTGFSFASQLVTWIDSKPVALAHLLPATKSDKPTTVACIAANPDQSKHLETATATLFDRDVDFVQLRSEEYGSNSRIPTEVTFGTPLQDSLRRDITINALFYNVHSRMVEDWTGKGLVDLLETPLIRCPLPPRQTFLDDPLRILRCIRFGSRFSFPLDPEIVQTVKTPEIKRALATKVSKERVYKETEKMLQHKNAIKAVELLHALDLFDLLFMPVPSLVLSRTLPAVSECSLTSLRLAGILDILLGNPATHDKPFAKIAKGLHPAIVQNETLSNADVRKRLFLASQLFVLGDVTTAEKKKTVQLSDKILKDTLSATNHDRQFVARLFKACQLVENPILSRFEKPIPQVALGLLLRNSNVHETLVGPNWQTSVLFSFAVELSALHNGKIARQRSRVSDHSTGEMDEARRLLLVYNSFVQQILDLNLPDYAFDKPRINGKEIASILGFNAEKETANLLLRVVEWQLANPAGTREDCLAWFADQWRQGCLDVKPPVKVNHRP